VCAMLGYVVLFVVVGGCGANYADKLVKIQELSQEMDDMLGEASYDCYENGACALEYKQGDLVTFRQEPECYNEEEGAEGCSRAAVIRKKRDMCGQLSEDMEQLCGGKKRMSNEECGLVLRDMEEQGCGDVVLEKRASCPDENWHLSRNICYRHYSNPRTFAEARKQCERDNGGLATLEHAIATPERAFFNDVIASSGTADLIDDVLKTLVTHYTNAGGWKEYYKYLDNWAWIGVRREGKAGDWKWASHKKEGASDWNSLKAGQGDWYNKQPTTNGSTPISVDHGNCVAYFQNDEANDQNEGAWWNLSCQLRLPFLCEQDSS